MAIKEQNQASRFERRWPVAVTILVVVGLLALMPGRIKLFPVWLPYVMGIAVLVPMALVGVTAAKALVYTCRAHSHDPLLFACGDWNPGEPGKSDSSDGVQIGGDKRSATPHFKHFGVGR